MERWNLSFRYVVWKCTFQSESNWWSKYGWIIESRNWIQGYCIQRGNSSHENDASKKTKSESSGWGNFIASLAQWQHRRTHRHFCWTRAVAHSQRIHLRFVKKETAWFSRAKRKVAIASNSKLKWVSRQHSTIGIEEAWWSEHRVYWMQHINSWK